MARGRLTPAAILALAAWLAPLGGPAAAKAAATPAARRPNVVLVVADDLGYGDVCAYGCDAGRTPEIDALAASGIRFTSGYVSGPLCTPTRAGLMTGRYQQRFGVEHGAGAIERVERDGLGMPVTEVTLPALLRGGGYRTGLVGKWHLGSQPQFHPMSRGFDEFSSEPRQGSAPHRSLASPPLAASLESFGFLHGGQLYFDVSDRPDVVSVPATSAAGADQPPRRIASNPMLRGRQPVEEAAYLTDALTRKAVDFIERHRDRPFFLYLACNAPHTPLQVDRERYERFAEVVDPRRRVYAAMVGAVDDGVGAVRRALEGAGIAENTLVLFLSDNGCPTYVDACSNGALLGGKLTPFEGGVRVPFIASWPGTFAPARVSDAPVSSLDVFPTLLALAGIAPPAGRPIDGIDLTPLLRDDGAGRPSRRTRTFYWRSRENFAVRRGRWKLVGMNQRPPYLFDLAESIEERRDLASSRPAVVRELVAAYRRWNAGMRAPLWTPVNEIVLEILLPWTGRKEQFVVTV